MFLDQEIRGDGLARNELCLTFDDGPGPDTMAIAELLADEGISATFFVLGKNATGRGQELRRLRTLGHLVGNHGYSHLRLPQLLASGGDPVSELVRTHEMIEDVLVDGPAFFRPPHGAWRGTDELTSAVGRMLNSTEALRGYIGPIGWDINGADWLYWKESRSVNECAARYFAEIAKAQLGIVLLHDGSEDEALSRVNRTGELVRLLVPSLRRGGCRFVPLSEVPAVRAASDGWP
jgi:peptidoglycan/xylan/chitin deacetylase (PgdA/CDA1 family)